MTDENAGGSEAPFGGFTRRNVVKAAGVAGLLGTTGSVQARESPNEQTMEQLQNLDSSEGLFDVGGRLIAGEIGYPTIQEAWNEANDGDTIYVHSTYDAESAGEVFPIIFDQSEKQVSLVGGTPSGSEINAEHAPNDNVIEIHGVGSADYRNTPMVKNLKIVGGNVGLKLCGAPGGVFSDLKFFKTNSHGAAITNGDDDNGCFGTRWYNCEAWSCGGSGFRMTDGARPHSSTFVGCKVTWCGWNGGYPGVRMRGYSSAWIGGTLQRNSSYGIHMQSGASQILRDTYFESNGLERDTPIDVYATGTQGTLIQGCYFQGRMFSPSSFMTDVRGHDQMARAITLHDTYRAQVRDCTYRNYDEGFVAVQGGYGRDNDVHEPSHYNIGSGDSFLARDAATRTRSNGVIRPRDLHSVDGTATGDWGIHDGSGSTPWGPCMWDGSNWVSLVSGDSL